MTHEELALSAVDSEAKLVKRFNDALSVMDKRERSDFGKGRLDFAGKRLIGENGKALQWRTRYKPEQPEAYDNQQTTVGSVYLVEIK
jgi:hypothetical protein